MRRRPVQTKAALNVIGVNGTPTQIACTDAHSVSQHILNRLTTFHHANTRGSRAGRLRIAHLCVLKQVSSTCHFSFLDAPDTDLKHKLSLSPTSPIFPTISHHQAIRRVTWKPLTTPWITEFLEHLFLQSSSRIQHVRKQGQEVDREVREPQA